MKTLLIAMICIVAAIVTAGCGKDPVNPADSAWKEPVTDEISIKMSSITAITDCDPTAGPGDFYITLIVHKTFEDGNSAEIGRSKEFLMQANDGETIGAPDDLMVPITFEMPRKPGATFTVEYYIRELDGNGATSFSAHGLVAHRFDRNEEDTWGPGSGDFDSYSQLNDGTIAGVYRFYGWSNAGDCRGYAKYAVYITPVYEQ